MPLFSRPVALDPGSTARGRSALSYVFDPTTVPAFSLWLVRTRCDEPDTDIDYAYDKAKQMLRLHTERGTVLRHAIRACRKGGTVSVVGVYGGLLDKFPMRAIVNKSLTLRSGQQPGQRYAKLLFEHIQKGQLDPSYLLTHPMSLEDAPQGYAMFKEKTEQCMRAVFQP